MNDGDLFGLSKDAQNILLQNIGREELDDTKEEKRRLRPNIPERYRQISELTEYKQLRVQHAVADAMGILNPFFACHQGMAKGRTTIQGEEFFNFSTYDYLGLNGHPQINNAAVEAIKSFGTSAGASRLVAGERPQHASLEKALAQVYEADAAVTFVSGHATNVSTIATILGRKDAVYHDSLAHNSIIQGALLSGATRYSYAHNDCDALERILAQTRALHQRVLIVTEGLFSMDGDVVDLGRLITLKQEFSCLLMVDEAHSLGNLGKNGKGIAEHQGISPTLVDIWMGTLSKTLCGCGGFIAGTAELIELLRFRAPGFVYSVGMSPPLAAASQTALELMLEEPERVARLQELSNFFLTEAQARGFNTGHAAGYGIIPIILGNSLVAGLVSAAMFRRKINVLPIIYPVVEEGTARLRFFISSEQSKEDMVTALNILAEEIPKAWEKAGHEDDLQE